MSATLLRFTRRAPVPALPANRKDQRRSSLPLPPGLIKSTSRVDSNELCHECCDPAPHRLSLHIPAWKDDSTRQCQKGLATAPPAPSRSLGPWPSFTNAGINNRPMSSISPLLYLRGSLRTSEGGRPCHKIRMCQETALPQGRPDAAHRSGHIAFPSQASRSLLRNRSQPCRRRPLQSTEPLVIRLL